MKARAEVDTVRSEIALSLKGLSLRTTLRLVSTVMAVNLRVSGIANDGND